MIAPSQLQDQEILLTTQQQHYLSRLAVVEGDLLRWMDRQWWLAVLEEHRHKS